MNVGTDRALPAPLLDEEAGDVAPLGRAAPTEISEATSPAQARIAGRRAPRSSRRPRLLVAGAALTIAAALAAVVVLGAGVTPVPSPQSAPSSDVRRLGAPAASQPPVHEQLQRAAEEGAEWRAVTARRLRAERRAERVRARRARARVDRRAAVRRAAARRRAAAGRRAAAAGPARRPTPRQGVAPRVRPRPPAPAPRQQPAPRPRPAPAPSRPSPQRGEEFPF